MIQFKLYEKEDKVEFWFKILFIIKIFKYL